MSENQNTQRHEKQSENSQTNGHENNKDHESVIPEEFLNEVPDRLLRVIF
jgi:hypothetical protein